jgi:hypothetical protein
VVSDTIKGLREYNIHDNKKQISEARSQLTNLRKGEESVIFGEIRQTMDPLKERAFTKMVESKSSSWLTVLPLAEHHFDLSPTEFRDGLSMRYRRPLKNLPSSCDGCGETFSIDHALNCKKGGLIILRHNEIRDAVGDLASIAWTQVHREPVVREANDAKGLPALVADLGIRGVWEPQALALLDIRVINTDAESYRSRPVQCVLTNAENEKKRKYKTACEESRSAFTPFITSTDGVLGNEAQFFIKHLAERLAGKWQRSYSAVMSWTRVRLSFAILRATCQCIRGSRRKWRCLGMEDGAPINFALT